MTNFQKLWNRRITDVYDEYFTRAREAEEARPNEHKACVVIQAFYRGYNVRKQLKIELKAAINIQRVFRGFVARVIFEQKMREKERQERMAYFDKNATIIQRIWRGYHSRKNVHSYYKRKAYIMGVVQKGEELLARRKLQQEIMEEEFQQEKNVALESKFKEEASKHHFMISTKAIPGVFRETKVGGTTDLEYYLKANRNINSPTKSPQSPQLDSTQFSLPSISTRRTESPPNKATRTTPTKNNNNNHNNTNNTALPSISPFSKSPQKR